MSFTLTITQRAPQIGTILLSPSKRRKIEPEEPTPNPAPTTSELWKWTLTHDAVASCFVQDIFEMKENAGKETDFFWLERVPCRTARIIGLIVGVQIYEKRIRYTVDDGTAVIDCLHRQQPSPKSPTKKPPSKTDTPAAPPPPKPVARIGSVACVVGRVVKKYGTRELIIDSIVPSKSPNDEPNHWREVRALHKSHYGLTTPFTIPPPRTIIHPISPMKPSTTSEPPTPCTVYSSPGSSVATSPAKSITAQSPHKLRHPSRLHSQQLIDNTFRIYIKHYMNHTAYADISTYEDDTESDTDTDNDLPGPSTPTKAKRPPPTASDETPRPGPSSHNVHVSRTPRPRIPRLSFAPDTKQAAAPQPPPPPPPQSFSASEPSGTQTPTIRGFTLSYLRRVPELAELARRVVKAEAKRRARAQRRKEKEAQAQFQAGSGSGSHSRSHSHSYSYSHIHTSSGQGLEERVASRMKRLFKWAIVQLLQEGSIVLWDGPTHPYPSFASAGTLAQGGLWKANTTSSSAGADSTVFSASSSRVSQEEDEDEELSDPEPHEEAYVPLLPRFLAGHVESAIGAIEKRKAKGGATKEAVLAWLRNDDRWRCVGEWNVQEALDILRTEGRAWEVGGGRWELSI
ncbi:hypothetical protein Hypma_003827 [Hypsizygus marmoreus]|uniref:CST complex subunit STN1 n=1 Tax=Hypsizygus marmoreus TaxID=39966 RepID=A0A369K1Y1_HYPMA|nr:hypothetical protein Hypma_003827 [Hypsizygus marmoreus]